jgi:hypothetical protein
MKTVKLIFSITIAMVYANSIYSASKDASDKAFGGGGGAGASGGGMFTGKSTTKTVGVGDDIAPSRAATEAPEQTGPQRSCFTFKTTQKVVYTSITNPHTGEDEYKCALHTSKTMGYSGPEETRLSDAKTAKGYAEAEAMLFFAQSLAAHLANPKRVVNPKAESTLKHLRDRIDIAYPCSPFSFNLSDTPPTNDKPE